MPHDGDCGCDSIRQYMDDGDAVTGGAEMPSVLRTVGSMGIVVAVLLVIILLIIYLTGMADKKEIMGGAAVMGVGLLAVVGGSAAFLSRRQ